MDFQHRPGGKTGSGGVASSSESNRDRRERLRQLALETIDINKVDPYFMKNHLGSYECKLCLTLHNNEVRPLPWLRTPAPGPSDSEKTSSRDLRAFCVAVTKQRDSEMGQQSLLFQIDYPEIAEGIMPRHRFMSAYEQRIEPPDRRWQYLLMAAEPYETIAFKVMTQGSRPVEPSFPQPQPVLGATGLRDSLQGRGFIGHPNPETPGRQPHPQPQTQPLPAPAVTAPWLQEGSEEGHPCPPLEVP
uniref:SF3A2 domain-containing protein n=1 Tax=Nomascus leucogenys TaxID=61853 RepID=A0A2I3HRB7_NOMLE